jgi:hypothetical protein
MDDRRFDNWTRALVGRGSRRRAVGGLVGGGLLALTRLGQGGVAARRGSSGPGDPCRHDDQCRAADTPLVCAWNGYDYNGGSACCTYEGNRCSDDTWCCGTNVCVGGYCSVDYSSGGVSISGTGGIATADASGGTVTIGDINSGGNVGNVIDIGNTTGSVSVDGGVVSNTTDVSVDASGGVAIADAAGGSYNIAGGGSYYGPGPYWGCSGQDCGCWQGQWNDDPCDWGYVCCHYSDDNNGICQTLYDCTGYGASGDVCPRYCDVGGSCPSCVSGYCDWNGYCG